MAQVLEEQRELAATLAAGSEAAAARVYAYDVRVTPLEETSLLRGGAGVQGAWLKVDSEQVTGSFKARGAVNALSAMPLDQRAQGVVAASTGNHALAVALALRRVPGFEGAANSIWLPSTVAAVKLDALKSVDAPVRVTDMPDCGVVEASARAHALSTGAAYVSPYNDVLVSAGQGTAGLEIAEQLEAALTATTAPGPLVVFVPIGGGGLITGVAASLKSRWRRSRCCVIGVQPDTNACMLHSVAAGRVLNDGEFDDGDTWSDGTAGGIEAGAFTFDACKHANTRREAVLAMLQELRSGAPVAEAPLVDALWAVSEDALKQGMRDVLDAHHKVIEGAAGMTVAAAQELARMGALDGCLVVAFVCGGNLATSRLRELLQE